MHTIEALNWCVSNLWFLSLYIAFILLFDDNTKFIVFVDPYVTPILFSFTAFVFYQIVVDMQFSVCMGGWNIISIEVQLGGFQNEVLI